MIISLLLGAVVGWLAGMIMKSKGGFIRNIILGIVGGGVGNWLAGAIGIGARNSVGSILIGVGGACVVIILWRLLFGNGKK